MENNKSVIIFGAYKSASLLQEQVNEFRAYGLSVYKLYEDFDQELFNNLAQILVENGCTECHLAISEDEFNKNQKFLEDTLPYFFEDYSVVQSFSENNLYGFREDKNSYEQTITNLKNSFSSKALLALEWANILDTYISMLVPNPNEQLQPLIQAYATYVSANNSKIIKIFENDTQQNSFFVNLQNLSSMKKDNKLQREKYFNLVLEDFKRSKLKDSSYNVATNFNKDYMKLYGVNPNNYLVETNELFIVQQAQIAKLFQEAQQENKQAKPLEEKPKDMSYSHRLKQPEPVAGYFEIEFLPFNLPWLNVVGANGFNPKPKRNYVYIGNIGQTFAANKKWGTYLTGLQTLHTFMTLKANKSVTFNKFAIYDFAMETDNQGTKFIEEYKALSQSWGGPIKIYVPQSLIRVFPWMENLVTLDQSVRIVTSPSFKDSLNAKISSDFYTLFEEIVKDVFLKDKGERARKNGFDYEPIKAGLRNVKIDFPPTDFDKLREFGVEIKEDAKVCQVSAQYIQNLIDAKGANKDLHVKAHELFKNKKIGELSFSDYEKIEEEDEKNLKEALKFAGNKNNTWIAKMLVILYQNFKNPQMYKSKGIDDKVSLKFLTELVREEDKELAKAAVEVMGGGIFLAAADQAKKIAGALKDDAKSLQDADKAAKEIIKEYTNTPEDEKLLRRINSHVRFKEIAAFFQKVQN